MHVFVERLTQVAASAPDREFIVEAESGRALHYGEALRAVRAVQALLAEVRAETVALTLPGSIPGAVLWLAALTGGYRLVPLAPEPQMRDRERVRRTFAPNLVVVTSEHEAEGLADDSTTVLLRRRIEQVIEQALPDPASNNAPAASGAERGPGYVFLTTSGTTGEPKWVPLDADRIAWTADHIRSVHQLTEHDRGLTALPFNHVNAPVVSLCASLMAGATVIIAQRFSRTNFWEWAERHSATWLSLVPTIMKILLQTEPNERPAFLPGSVRFVRSASAPLPISVLLEFRQRFGLPVVETYGLTEAASTAAANPVPPGIIKPGSVGLPVGLRMRIASPRQPEEAEPCEVPVGETGEVCVAGPSIVTGYVGGADAESFQGGWFRTGDLGRRDDDGYLYITGRLRDVIIRGGENVAPRDVEEVLLAHPAVLDAAVVGAPDAMYGERVVAFVVPRAPWAERTERELAAHARKHLSPPAAPVEWLPVSDLPHNHTGKIDRQALRRLYAMELAHETNPQPAVRGKRPAAESTAEPTGIPAD